MVRRNRSIPEVRTVRTFPARPGGEEGGPSRFVDEAARRRGPGATVGEIEDRNARRDRHSILDPIGEEVDAARAGRP